MISCPLCSLEVTEYKILVGSHAQKHLNPSLSSYSYKLLILQHNSLPYNLCLRCQKPIVLQNKSRKQIYCSRECYSPNTDPSLGKVCKRCFINKPLQEFYSAPNFRLGVESFCKICVKKPKKDRVKKEKTVLQLLKEQLRSLIWHQINQGGYTKRSKTEQLIGLSFDNFKLHIEKQFQENMSWENYGLKGWTLDHICPVSQAQTEDELLKLQHFSNWRPLWHIENIKKSNSPTLEAVAICSNLLIRDWLP